MPLPHLLPDLAQGIADGSALRDPEPEPAPAPAPTGEPVSLDKES